MDGSANTVQINGWLDRIRTGDSAAKEELLAAVAEQLRRLTRKMLRGFAGVRRWEETDDVFVNALLRLSRALESVQLETPRHFFRLAAVQIRRELLDLSRHYFGPHGQGANYQSLNPDDSTGNALDQVPENAGFDPLQVGGWEEFHRRVGELPDDERETFELLWYHELTQADAAEMLEVSRRTVIRRWQSACLRLHTAIADDAPSESR